MPDPSKLGMFVVASIVLLMIPGPTVMYIVTRGVQQGRSAALVSVLGVDVGTIILLVSTVLGISAVIVSVGPALSAMQYLGAAYLLGLGISAVRGGTRPVQADAGGSSSLAPIFLQGVVVQTLNPKTMLFFLAFLPQFADPARGPVERQMLALGLAFVSLAVVTHGLFGLLAGSLGDRLRDNMRFQAARRCMSGCVYMSLSGVMVIAGPAVH